VDSPLIDDQHSARPRTDAAGRTDFEALWRAAWQGRWTVLLTTFGFAAAMAIYTLLATPWYRAQVSLLPVENKDTAGLMSQIGQLSGLASLAGINLGGNDKAEPFAVLQSHDFARAFIEKEKLLTVLLADKWDATSGRWRTTTADTPDIRDAVEYFEKHVRRVGEDRKTGLIILTVDWTDPTLAAAWANAMALQINAQMREVAIEHAQTSIAYLRSELAATNQVSLQQAISRLLESQMQRLMVARGNEEYAFRVVDRAHVPKKRFMPQRVLMTLAAAIVGAFLSSAFLALSGSRRAAALRVT
jgi:uncharacterized protein involved in exopolysaccharide biosynthesis